MKSVLVTGNLGYIGSVLTRMLGERGYRTIGYDTGYFEECALLPIPLPDRQIRKDIRNISLEDLRGIHAVIHLAALSNDPLGELAPALTEDINGKATIRLAACAKEAGARRFVYASSQSMYGIADTSREVEEDSSEKNPLTAYAATKWRAECALMKLADDSFTVVALRPSTVFGASPALRTDSVFNNLVACAYTTGRIEIKSDGSPWRPVVHVEDLSRAFVASLEAPAHAVQQQAFNVGAGNFTVRALAQIAQSIVPHSTLTFTNEHGKDSRTYRVSFEKLERTLGFVPTWDLLRGGAALVEFLKSVHFTEDDFRGRRTIRLKQITHLKERRRLNAQLLWENPLTA